MLLDGPEKDEEWFSDAVFEELVEKTSEPASEQFLRDGLGPAEEQLRMRSTLDRSGDQLCQQRLQDVRAILQTS